MVTVDAINASAVSPILRSRMPTQIHVHAVAQANPAFGVAGYPDQQRGHRA